MKFQDLKEWVNTLGEEELAVPLTPYNLLESADPKMGDALDEFLGTIFMNGPTAYQIAAIRLLVLLHIPIK